MIRILVHNHSHVFGGQERYLEDLVSYFGSQENISISLVSEERINDNCGADVVLLNGNAALYRYWRQPQGTFIIYVQHSDIEDRQAGRLKCFIRKWLVKFLLKRVDLVIRVCKHALPNFYAPGKIVTIYNGVTLPPSYFVPTLSDSLSLLMVGGITENKNQKMAIDALSLLPAARLIIVGTGPEEPRLRVYAKEIGVADRVHWAGFVQDPTPYYQQANLLLMLSHYEAFPYAVLEAMSHGRPVVSTAVGGVPEIIKQNENGWLLSAYSSFELAERIKHIVNDENLYVAIAHRARRTIENDFTVERMANQLLAEINKGVLHREKVRN